VLRNYWMYEGQMTGRGTKRDSASRAALAQGMWPRFPGLPGASAVRLNNQPAPTAMALASPVPVGQPAATAPGFSDQPGTN
jgi:soluble lytic murein transglycosylase